MTSNVADQQPPMLQLDRPTFQPFKFPLDAIADICIHPRTHQIYAYGKQVTWNVLSCNLTLNPFQLTNAKLSLISLIAQS